MLQRDLFNKVKFTLSRGKSILLLGPRQVGKTTLVKELYFDRYITFMDPNHLRRYEIEPGLLIQEIEALTRSLNRLPLVILDEIQKAPAIMDSIQVLIDNKSAQFVLTGSSARKLRNLLPGRVIYYQLDPLVLTELAPLHLPLEHFLLNGSLPAIATISQQTDINEELSSYVHTYLEEEIRKEALVRNIPAFSHFLKLAATESGNLVSFRNIAQEIGVSHSTIAEYYHILEDCMIAERFEPLTKSLTRKRLTKSPKYILFDLGIRRLSAQEGYPLPEQLLPKLFEQWVGLELRHLTRQHSSPVSIKFWRDHSGPEVDWVIEINNTLIPIEVKWTNTPTLKDARHLETFMQEYGIEKSFIVCRAPYPAQLNKKVTALPWQHLPQLLNLL